MAGGVMTHGQYSTYVDHNCRCDECRAAFAAYIAKRKAERALGIAGNTKQGGRSEPEIHNAATYTNWRCRCDQCRAAWNAYVRKRRSERLAGVQGDVARGGRLEPQVHNASAYYNWNCRCQVCIADASAKRASS